MPAITHPYSNVHFRDEEMRGQRLFTQFPEGGLLDSPGAHENEPMIPGIPLGKALFCRVSQTLPLLPVCLFQLSFPPQGE